MRCSLLVLSSYLDRELSAERAAEVDAHIIGCTRCRTALGYLHEESERIGALARVSVPGEAGYQMFVELKLIAPEALPPHETYEPEPVLAEAISPLPMDAEPMLPYDDVSGHVLDTQADVEPMYEIDEPVETTVMHDIEPVHEEITPEPVELAGYAHRDAYGPSQPPAMAPEPVHADEPIDVEPAIAAHHVVAEHAAIATPPMPPPLPGPPQRIAPAGVPSFLHRIRDRVALRWALMRGGAVAGVEDDIDGAEIVIGAGSAAITTRPVTPVETGRWEYEEEAPAAASQADALWPARHHAPAATAVAEPPRRTVEPPPDDLPKAPLPDHPPAQGRHARSLGGGGHSARPSWMNLDTLSRRTRAISRPAVGVPATDRRLLGFIAGVVVLGIIGVLVGRSVTSLPVASNPAAAPHASAVPSAPAQSIAPATPVPTQAPPPPPSPTQLSGIHSLGSGASGYTVGTLRYGSHPGDFRMVFDLTGTSTTTPDVVIGWGNATTLYVEFVGVAPGGVPNNPLPGNTVVASHLLSMHTVPGRAVYQFDLAHAATLSAYYLTGPTRLVIDLT